MREYRTLAWAVLLPLSVACQPGGCGGGGGTGGADSGPGGAAGAGGAAGGGGAGGGGATGTGGETDASADSTVGGSGGAAGLEASTGDSSASDAADSAIGGSSGSGTDAAPDASATCGDGIRDPNEECDDGNAISGDACLPTCLVDDFALVPGTPNDSGIPVPGRYLGAGRHPVAAGSNGFAVVYVEPGFAPPRVGLAAFDPKGAELAPAFTISTGAASTPLLFSNPVVAALPSGKFATAWTDFNGDGDELGIAVQLVDAIAPPAGEPEHANTTTAFSQLDPDILWTGSELVVAWVDDSSATTGGDIRFREFDSNLVPTASEQTLAATTNVESDVALATFGSGWAAAWRASASAGMETVEVKAGSSTWSVGPQAPASPDDVPALVELDAMTLLVVFVEGDGGTGAGSRLRGAILPTSSVGSVSAFSLEPPGVDAGYSEPAHGRPDVVSVGGHIFIAWHADAATGNPLAEDLWLREASWNGTSLTLADPITLPRWGAHTPGDQRFPALAATPLGPGGALAVAWDDYGQVLGGAEGAPDVVAELIPVPILRTSVLEGGLGQ